MPTKVTSDAEPAALKTPPRHERRKSRSGSRQTPAAVGAPVHPARPSSALMSLRVTFSGVLCVVVVLLVGLAALNSEANLLFLLFGISFGAVLCAAIAPVVMVRKLEVERVLPSAVIAGRPFTFEYVLRSRRRWLRSWALVVGEIPIARSPAKFPLAFVEALKPGDPLRVELTGLCPVRGRVLLAGVRVLSRFPFGLFASSVDLKLPGELVVYPAVGRFRRDLWRDSRLLDSPVLRSARRMTAEHDEFYGVREYRLGDNLRWVHWRRSAHAGRLVVRESTPVRTQQLTVIVDPWPEAAEKPLSPGDGLKSPGIPAETGRGAPAGAGAAGPVSMPSSRSFAQWAGLMLRRAWLWLRRRRAKPELWPREAVEQIISLAVTAICDALERGHRVGLIARGGIPVVIAPSGGRPQRQRLLHELALLKPGAREGLDDLISRVRWSGGWHGRCLVCATHYNRTHGEVVQFLAARAEAALVITRDSENFDGIFESPRPGGEGRTAPERRGG